MHGAARSGDDAGSSADPADLSAVVRGAQCGDDQAFRTLYRAVQPSLLRYLQVMVGADAEDVASEAWLQVARDLTRFHGDGDGFRGWVATIARHRAIDHLRRQGRRPIGREPVERLAELAADTDTATSALDSAATDAALALIARLPVDQAEAVLLRVVMGLDAKTAARVLGKRAGAVRTAAHRGLRKLAEYLDEDAAVPGHAADRAVRTEGFVAGVTQTRASTLREVR
jgi:RNA polymerase sigma-70 factor (ECF subfamily)